MAKKNIVEKTKNNKVVEANIEGNNNHKGILIFLGIIFTFVVVVGTVGIIALKNDKVTYDDNKDFKTEYESYNGKVNEKNGKVYPKVKINPNNIVYSDYEEIFDVIDNKTGVIFLGFPTCPWCRNLVPVLLEASDEVGIDKIYYLNNLDDRDIKTLKDGEIIVEKEGTDNYYKLVDKVSDYLRVYDGLEDDSIKRVYYPTVLFVKEGKVIDSHIATVDSQKDPYKELTKEQHNELFDALVSKMYKTISCDDAC